MPQLDIFIFSSLTSYTIGSFLLTLFKFYKIYTKNFQAVKFREKFNLESEKILIVQ